METKFELCDKVRAFGVDGVVNRIDRHMGVSVRFINGTLKWFICDGRAESWHKEPSLILVEKAKKEEPVIQWYSVLAHIKGSKVPTPYGQPYMCEEDFLSTIGYARDNFHWIKLIPMCKTHGNKLVEE